MADRLCGSSTSWWSLLRSLKDRGCSYAVRHVAGCIQRFALKLDQATLLF